MTEKCLMPHVTIKGLSHASVQPDLRRVKLCLFITDEMDGNPFIEPLFYPSMIRSIVSECCEAESKSCDTSIQLSVGNHHNELVPMTHYMHECPSRLDISFCIEMPVSPQVWRHFLKILHDKLPRTPYNLSVEYVMLQSETLEIDLLHHAMENARSKAQALASLNSCHLGSLISVVEETTEITHSSSAEISMKCEVQATWQLVPD